MRKVLLSASVAALALMSAASLALAAEPADQPGQQRAWGPGQMLRSADTNNDGSVTQAEFTGAHAAHFAEADANGDGELTREEMRAARGDRGRDGPPNGNAAHGQHGEHGEHQGGGERRANANPIDADGNGTINRAEFDAMGERMFARLDANSDGVIGSDEARPPNPPRAQQ